MTHKAEWSKAEITDILNKANGLYQTIVGLTASPREAAEIICMVHMLLYFNCGSPEFSIDVMLDEYCKNLKINFAAQHEAMEKVAN